MDSSIISLKLTDQATKQMLQNLVDRKLKFDRLKQRHIILLWISVLYSFTCLYFLYYFILEPYSYSFADIFSIIVGENNHLFFLFIAIGTFGATKVLYEKKEKAEKEYHELRCEIIDRSKDLWKNEAWKSRNVVFEMMKEKYNINLYHESK
ncbi:DUF2663 family protein [Heyndrickxia sp. FSL W8-0423]|uniref:DUF2663 family protein n=1 Tax=Heyndrickxia sp. FSL W8-0423 TaxID=2921601 RepID=UPI0030F769B1